MGRKAPVKVRIFARPHTLPAKASIAHQFARIAVLQSGADALRQPSGTPRKVTMVSSCPARFADRRRARDTIPPLPPATARRRCGAAKAITASCCQRYPYCAVPPRTPMREKRTLPNRAPKPAETATALYPAATAYGLRPTPANSPGGGSYRGGLPVLQRRKREFTDLIARAGSGSIAAVLRNLATKKPSQS